MSEAWFSTWRVIGRDSPMITPNIEGGLPQSLDEIYGVPFDGQYEIIDTVRDDDDGEDEQA